MKFTFCASIVIIVACYCSRPDSKTAEILWKNDYKNGSVVSKEF